MADDPPMRNPLTVSPNVSSFTTYANENSSITAFIPRQNGNLSSLGNSLRMTKFCEEGRCAHAFSYNLFAEK